jgi:integrase
MYSDEGLDLLPNNIIHWTQVKSSSLVFRESGLKCVMMSVLRWSASYKKAGLCSPPVRRAAVQAVGDQQTDDLSELLSADIRTIQDLLGHCDVNTMMVYSHVLNRGPSGLRSPADLLCGTE